MDDDIKAEIKILNPEIFPEEKSLQKSKPNRGWER